MSIKEQYRKARQNLLRRVRTWKKKGFELTIDIPSIPKTPTRKSIERLKKFQLPELVKRGKVVSRETKQVYTPYQYETEQEAKRRVRREMRREMRRGAEEKRQKWHDYEEQERKEETRSPYEPLSDEDYEGLLTESDYAELMSKQYHEQAGTKMERDIEYEDQSSAEIENLDILVQQCKQQVVINKWNELRSQFTDREIAESILSIESLYEQLQETVEAVLYYEARGNDYKARQAGTEFVNYLEQVDFVKGKLTPLSAEEWEQMGSEHYAQ